MDRLTSWTLNGTPETQPPPGAFNNATFVYDGDGKRVKSTFNGITTTYFVGAHFEVTGSTITKYYGVYPERVEGLARNGSRCEPTAH